MPTLRWSRTGISTFVAILAFALSSQLFVTAQEQVVEGQTLAAEEQVPALAPDPGPSWEEESGYLSVEASRVDMVMTAGTTTDSASGYRSVEATRVLIAQRALEVGNLGSMQEDALRAVVAVAGSWDETSGYGAVEASRAATTLPTPSIAPGSLDDAKRALVAQHALLSPDLGSLQEEALMAIVAASTVWDETSGYGTVEANRAVNPAPLADTLQQAVAIGTRAETAHLATIPLPIKLAPDDAD